MYNKIVNPNTGRNVSIYGKIGKTILKNYLYQLGGDNHCETLKINILDMDKKEWCEKLLDFFRKLHSLYLKNGITKDKDNIVCCPFISFRTNINETGDLIFNFTITEKMDYKKNLEWRNLITEEEIILGDTDENRITIKTNSKFNSSILHATQNSIGKDCIDKTGYFGEYKPYFNVFVKDYTNLTDYIDKFVNNQIKPIQVYILFKYLINRMKETGKEFTLDNHNEDVSILHFKYSNRQGFPGLVP